MKSSDVSQHQWLDPVDGNNLRSDALTWYLGTHEEKTISSGIFAITIGKSYYTVDTEGDAASDDLDTITGGSEGNIIILLAENTARTIVVKDATGNIFLGNNEDFSITDDLTGIVLIKNSSGNWIELYKIYVAGGGVNSGLILLFADDCPTGWTRVTALDGKYIRGSSVYGGIGGGGSHNHTLTTLINHTHNASGLIADSAGAHTHTTYYDTASWGYTFRLLLTTATSTMYVSAGGSHTHTVSGSTLANGDASPVSGAETPVPPYLEMIFCKKD